MADARCPGGPPHLVEDEPTTEVAVVFVRRGALLRAVDGRSTVVDTASYWVERPGTRQSIGHPLGPDVSTALILDPHLLGSLADPDRPSLPAAALTPPAADLAHRLLLSRSRRPSGAQDAFTLAEEVLLLAGNLLRHMVDERPGPTRHGRDRWAKISEKAKLRLATADAGLVELARELKVSPVALSRHFHEVTGLTLGRYRRRLRVRQAVHCVAQGERNLAALAATLGFADQSHLTRAVRAEYGITPSRLRTGLLTRDPQATDTVR